MVFPVVTHVSPRVLGIDGGRNAAFVALAGIRPVRGTMAFNVGIVNGGRGGDADEEKDSVELHCECWLLMKVFYW